MGKCIEVFEEQQNLGLDGSKRLHVKFLEDSTDGYHTFESKYFRIQVLSWLIQKSDYSVLLFYDPLIRFAWSGVHTSRIVVKSISIL